MNKAFETPILFLIFNRPDTTLQVFNRLKVLKPKYLYVAADGPRESKTNELEKCEETRNIIKQINWDCELKTLFREKNLGCGKAVSSAISWFFDNVEEGIILEDDCLPSLSFFKFSSELLEKYRTDQRIWHISGYNLQEGKKRGSADYYFSQETPIWGWATWRRVWKHYNLTLESLSELEKTSSKVSLKVSKIHSLTALYDYRKVTAGKVDTWDYQYSYYQLVNHGLSIVPNSNLVENIGFTPDATHQNKQKDTFIANKATDVDYSEMKHPLFVLPHVEADKYTYNKRTRLIKKIYIMLWFYLFYRNPNKQ